MTHYTNILQEAHIRKIDFSNVSEYVYDAFWAKPNLDADIDLIEMQLLLSFLAEQSKMVIHLLNHDKLNSQEEESQAISFLSKVAHLKEAFEIVQGTTTVEKIEAASKTLAPKMQSSFGND